MRSIHEFWERVKNGKIIRRIRSVKNVEIVIAAILALIAIIGYFWISAASHKSKSTGVSAVEVKLTDEETRLSAILSEMEGIGEARVFISYGDDNVVKGVVVVAKGADNAEKRVSVIRCVEIATGATVDQIQIFQMANGG